MSYLDRIRDCNQARLQDFIPLFVDDRRVGWLTASFINTLSRWPQVFHVDDDAVSLQPQLRTPEQRTRAIAAVCEALVEQGVIPHRHGEWYPVSDSNRAAPAWLLDRAAAPFFGIRSYGQHLNGFVRDGNTIKMWIGRRAGDKMTFPRMLDNMVAGGLPHGQDTAGNLIKECQEEAGIPAALAAKARPVSAISYCRQTLSGVKPDIAYCYDLELSAEFRPHCTDGEVEEFYLWPLEQVAQTVCDSREFKFNCALVIIDFLIRHGHINPDHPDYLALVSGLHQ
jgi:isopentenyldiphosphate isomerase